MTDVMPEFDDTDEEMMRDADERLSRPYDDVFLPDGSLLTPMSVMSDDVFEPDAIGGETRMA